MIVTCIKCGDQQIITTPENYGKSQIICHKCCGSEYGWLITERKKHNNWPIYVAVIAFLILITKGFMNGTL